MTSSKYIIQRVILDLEIEDANQPEALQRSEAFKKQFLENMLPYLEPILKKYERHSAHIQIDKLDISLEDFNLNQISTIQDVFEKKIVNALSELGLSINDIAGETGEIANEYVPRNLENVSIISKTKRQADLLVFYLKHGYLPWNSTPEDFSDPIELLKEVLRDDSDYFKQEVRTLVDSEQAMKRFVFQFPETLVQQTLLLLSKEVFSELEMLFSVSKKEIIGSTNRTAHSILSEAALKYAMNANQSESREFIVQAILKEAARMVNKDLPFLIEAVKTPFSEDVLVIEEIPTIDDSSELLETEGVYINNAGLILTWPYLQLFFKELNVYTENGLTDKEKAMHLLHYLCFGMEEEWECALFLSKIICGWDLEMPLGEKITLADSEKEECDQLIEAIVRNWPALKNTSVDGFREAFLQREGIISKVNDNWLLRIERKGYDVMLEQLEWGINTIQLSWNDYTIFVEW